MYVLHFKVLIYLVNVKERDINRKKEKAFYLIRYMIFAVIEILIARF